MKKKKLVGAGPSWHLSGCVHGSCCHVTVRLVFCISSLWCWGWSVTCNCGISWPYSLAFFNFHVYHSHGMSGLYLLKKLQNLKILSAPIKVLSDRSRVRLFCYIFRAIIPIIVQFLKRHTFKIVSGWCTDQDWYALLLQHIIIFCWLHAI